MAVLTTCREALCEVALPGREYRSNLLYVINNVMKSSEFITEGTEIFVGNDDYPTQVFAVRTSRRGIGSAVQMLITKDEWNQIKKLPANTETYDYDIATAETIVNDMVNHGATVLWKTAADFNKDARELETHRFAKDPALKHGFDQAAGDSRQKAKDTARASLSTVSEDEGAAKQDITNVNNLLKRHNAFKEYDARVTGEQEGRNYYIVVDLGWRGVEDEQLYDMLLGMKTSPNVHIQVVNNH